MKYVYPTELVSPQPDLSPRPVSLQLDLSAHFPSPHDQGDTLHSFLQRRLEARKNNAKFHLTEEDCKLLCTNAKELKFNSGQVVVAEGAIFRQVYRIRCGTVSLVKEGVTLFELTKGYFIGEAFFISAEEKDILGATLIANGPVIISELNLDFVRHLINADKLLAFKIYRHIATMLSVFIFSILPLDSCFSPYISRGRSDSMMSTSSDSSDLGSSAELDNSEYSTNSATKVSNLLHFPNILKNANSVANLSIDGANASPRNNKNSKKLCFTETRKDKAVKRYQLYDKNTGGQLKLYNSKFVVISASKLAPKKTIKFNKIWDIAKAARNSVTIIYSAQAKTVFFKDEEERDEFFALLQSLIASSNFPPSPRPRSSTLTQLPPPVLTHEVTLAAEEKSYFRSMAVQQELVKGDVVIAEGDLYQRVYTLVAGQLAMKRGGYTMLTIEEGEVFGLVTLFHMRPYVVSIEVVSDTATLLIIPAYKIRELESSNFPLAVRLHKKAAQVLYGQSERILMSHEGVVKGYSQSGVFV